MLIYILYVYITMRNIFIYLYIYIYIILGRRKDGRLHFMSLMTKHKEFLIRIRGYSIIIDVYHDHHHIVHHVVRHDYGKEFGQFNDSICDDLIQFEERAERCHSPNRRTELSRRIELT